MTLGSFFRDYVYIPLGGNKKAVLRNLLIVWFLTGFWHGANWNFIVWGLYNGFFIIAEKYTKKWFEKIPAFIRHIYLLTVVNVGFVFFKFTSMTDAVNYIKVMFSGGASFTNTADTTTVLNNIYWIALALILCIPVMKLFENLYEKSCKSGVIVSTAANTVRVFLLFAILIISVAHLTGNSFNPFLYHSF